MLKKGRKLPLEGDVLNRIGTCTGKDDILNSVINTPFDEITHAQRSQLSKILEDYKVTKSDAIRASVVVDFDEQESSLGGEVSIFQNDYVYDVYILKESGVDLREYMQHNTNGWYIEEKDNNEYEILDNVYEESQGEFSGEDEDENAENYWTNEYPDEVSSKSCDDNSMMSQYDF